LRNYRPISVGGDSTLTTSDGVALAADVNVPPTPFAVAVLCHPHPLYGGNRHAVVIDPLFQALPHAGIAALRFDFRGAGSSAGTHGDGIAERLDVVAAIDAATARVPGVPLIGVGYSFGADIVLSTDDARFAARAVIAPPLHFLADPVPAAVDGKPLLVVTGAHDEVAPPFRTESATASWGEVTFETVAGADHFFAGAASRVCDLVAGWITGLVR
jgi:alpha/beta superfamily hydrolase